MKSLFKFSAFEITVAVISTIVALISGMLLLAGTSLNGLPNFSEAIPPPVFEANYRSAAEESIPQASESAIKPILRVSSPDASPGSSPAESPNTSPTEAPPLAVSPFPSLAPSKYERIYLIYPTSQAILTHTGASEGKAYSLKLKFEVSPQNTPCRLELKMGEELILVKELEGSPTGLYEVSVSLKKPALYRWQIFTSTTQSGERLFTIRK